MPKQRKRAAVPITQSPKFKKVMAEPVLHSGSKTGPVVPRSKIKQRLAIAYSEARRARQGHRKKQR